MENRKLVFCACVARPRNTVNSRKESWQSVNKFSLNREIDKTHINLDR